MEETGGPSGVLGEMSGWLFDWEKISSVAAQYDSSLYWLVIVLVAIFVLGTQVVFFPFFYRGLKFQATGSMRLAYLSSFLLAVIMFHWWLWKILFVALTKNYWVWLAWGLLFLTWGSLVFLTPRRKQES